MNKYIMEFIGTFFLVLVICMTVIGGAGNFAPIAIGLCLMTMVYAGGHISGAHYNPAVTIMVVLRGKCEASDILGYIIAQALAAFIAVFMACPLLNQMNAVMPVASLGEPLPLFLAEFLGTFGLCHVILNVATVDASEGNSFYGVAIGCAVLFGAYAFGPVSGGAFNPAVTLGAAHAGLIAWPQVWIYLIAQFSAGIATAAIFRITVEE